MDHKQLANKKKFLARGNKEQNVGKDIPTSHGSQGKYITYFLLPFAST
jgi:hypothetical protein